MQMRQMSLGKLEELSDVAMKGCWRGRCRCRLKHITHWCCHHQNRWYCPTCLQTAAAKKPQKYRKIELMAALFTASTHFLLFGSLKLRRKIHKSEKR